VYGFLDELEMLRNALNVYGKLGDKSVMISMETAGNADVAMAPALPGLPNKYLNNVAFPEADFKSPSTLGLLIAHEGMHVYQNRHGQKSGTFAGEYDAYWVESQLAAIEFNAPIDVREGKHLFRLWDPTWGANTLALRRESIIAILTLPRSAGGIYGYPRPPRR
jgi:hypothetical protein